MIAVILAGGKGTRLRPITNKIPKPMVKIGGIPLLLHHMEALKKAGIKNVWLATNYLHEVIENYFKDGADLGLKIKYSKEIEGLGTAGALKNPNSEIERDLAKDDFLVVYSDNYTNFNFTKIIRFHYIKNSFMTIGLFKSKEPWTCGVIERDESNKITRMTEKPPKKECKSNLVNAGIYVCQPKILNYIPRGFADFGFDVIPAILKANHPTYGFGGNYIVQDIGTPERLKEARKLHTILNIK